MRSALKFIALVVSDLRAAEAYYRTVFDMELIGREALLADGLWYTLPFDKDWDDAQAAGVALGMLALRRGGFALALFAGEASPGQVFAVGLAMSPEEVANVRSHLPDDTPAHGEGTRLEFRDPYGILWQISTGDTFQTAGTWAGRWIELDTEKAQT